MYHWTEHQADGKQRWQALLAEAENRRRAKRAGASPSFLGWLRHQLTRQTKQSEAGRLRPANAKE